MCCLRFLPVFDRCHIALDTSCIALRLCIRLRKGNPCTKLNLCQIFIDAWFFFLDQIIIKRKKYYNINFTVYVRKWYNLKKNCLIAAHESYTYSKAIIFFFCFPYSLYLYVSCCKYWIVINFVLTATQ